MQLNQFAYSTANFPSSVHDNQVILKMTGLNFRNSTYNPKTGNNTNEYQLLVANIATSTSATIYIFNKWLQEISENWCHSGFKFRKQKKANIEI